MSRSPDTLFKTLKVHTGTPPVPAPRATTLSQRFSELLQRRPPVKEAASALPVRPPAPVVRERTELEQPALDRAPAEDLLADEIESQAEPDAILPVESPRTQELPRLAETQAVVDTAAADNAIARYLAQTVVGFCNDHAVGDGDGWQVSMRLRSDLLAATTLHLSLSVHWLQLRFDSKDERARGLVLRHQDSLHTLLDEALVPRRDIAITID
jgi:type III secretion control protein HpaP